MKRNELNEHKTCLAEGGGGRNSHITMLGWTLVALRVVDGKTPLFLAVEVSFREHLKT